MKIGVENMCKFRRMQCPIDRKDRLGIAVATLPIILPKNVTRP